MMTKREQISLILVSSFGTLKESMGAQEFTDLVALSAQKIIELNKPKEQIIHVVGPNGIHRLIVDGETTPWCQPHEICRFDTIVATTDSFMNQLPQVGYVRPIEAIHFNTVSQQNTNLEILRFEHPVKS